MYGGKRCTGVKKHPTEITATIISFLFFSISCGKFFYTDRGKKQINFAFIYGK